jgi:hypothetical protein
MQIPIASSATVKVSTVSFFRVERSRSGHERTRAVMPP